MRSAVLVVLLLALVFQVSVSVKIRKANVTASKMLEDPETDVASTDDAAPETTEDTTTVDTVEVPDEEDDDDEGEDVQDDSGEEAEDGSDDDEEDGSDDGEEDGSDDGEEDGGSDEGSDEEETDGSEPGETEPECVDLSTLDIDEVCTGVQNWINDNEDPDCNCNLAPLMLAKTALGSCDSCFLDWDTPEHLLNLLELDADVVKARVHEIKAHNKKKKAIEMGVDEFITRIESVCQIDLEVYEVCEAEEEDPCACDTCCTEETDEETDSDILDETIPPEIKVDCMSNSDEDSCEEVFGCEWFDGDDADEELGAHCGECVADEEEEPEPVDSACSHIDDCDDCGDDDTCAWDDESETCGPAEVPLTYTEDDEPEYQAA